MSSEENINNNNTEKFSNYQNSKKTLIDRPTLEQLRNTKVTYSQYLQIQTLLSLQNSSVKGGLNHHDEHLFIVVHQSFELWFSQILFELTTVKDDLEQAICASSDQATMSELFETFSHRIRRSDEILRMTLSFFDILETMHASDFLEFRDYIGPASGFQSAQHREMEILFGLDEKQRLTFHGEHYAKSLQTDKFGSENVNRRLHEKTIKQLVYEYLERFYESIPVSAFLEEFRISKVKNLEFQKSIWLTNPEEIKQAVDKEYQGVEVYLSGTYVGDESSKESIVLRKQRRISLLYVSSYRNETQFLSHFSQFLDALVGFEEAILLWKLRHVRMVERMIGRRIGTGGSSGVDYLEATGKYRILEDLWEVRSFSIRSSSISPVIDKSTTATSSSSLTSK